MILNNNNRFDTTKPILESLAEHAFSNEGELRDYIFVIACAEYEVEEQPVMDAMMASTEYKFKRYATGWTVYKKKWLK